MNDLRDLSVIMVTFRVLHDMKMRTSHMPNNAGQMSDSAMAWACGFGNDAANVVIGPAAICGINSPEA